jgi:Asp-tRNA(Asn)/Glu-tRNA(Gln) amidotransferase A subunit family amidase
MQHGVSEDTLREVASTLGLEPDDAELDAFLEPVRSILGSMERLDAAAPPSGEVASVRPPDAATDPHNAFITSCIIERGSDGPLRGLDVALKDNIAVAGVPMTAGSTMLRGCVPARNAPVTDRLLDAGARVVGKANMDEFAFGPTGETSAYGPTRNPRDPEYTPGGSSSGSAAAVASGTADLALGTDTGGSVRIPASYCGVLGLKPTLGAIPTEGVVELAGSLDTVGLLSTSVPTLARGLDTLAEGFTADGEPAPLDPAGTTIGVPEPFYGAPADAEVAETVRDVVEGLVAAGATERQVELPGADDTSPVWRAIAMSELYMYMLGDALPYRQPAATPPGYAGAFGDARRARIDRLSEPLKQYLLIGGVLVTEDGGRRYASALASRRRVARAVEDAFEEVDLLVTPTTPTTAFAFGEFSRASSPPINGNTHPFNLSGHPALSVPCGRLDGLPVGLQLVGPAGSESRLLRAAQTVEGTVDG